MAGREGGAGARRSARVRRAASVVLALLLLNPVWKPGSSEAAIPTVEDLRRLSIEELVNIDVTSVSRRIEPLSRAPAAVYVITNEAIRRAGARTVPEALRLAPNLIVAQVDAARYAISARGFNTVEAANKLLVMIDGRSIYTPLHGAVFWDQQQMMMEDIDRIEVISGPGGTLWGANATNGIINIITKRAADTQGGLVAGYVGNVQSGGAARYGGAIGQNGFYRGYAAGFARADSRTATGADAGDSWNNRQAGFRFDWTGERDAITVQGDLFENRPEFGGQAVGRNLLARWGRRLHEGSSVEVQAYYDTVERDTPGIFQDDLETFDIQGQHSVRFGRHNVVWGGGHRVSKSEFRVFAGPFFVDPPKDTVQISNLFAQNEIEIREGLHLTVGTKLEYSGLSGLEFMPNARLGWQASATDFLWAAVSRAMRTPSRIDRGLVGPGILEQARGFQSEELIAYEVGYRTQPTARTALSVSLYWHDYDDLRVLTVSPDTGLLRFGNAMEGSIYGAEMWGSYSPRDWWRISAGLNLMRKNLDFRPGAVELALDQHAGNDPEYQFFLRSSMNLAKDVELDIGLRAIDDLPRPAVPSYLAVDARIAWHVTDALELSLAGQNLFDPQHPEAGAAAGRREVRRSVHAGVRWRF